MNERTINWFGGIADDTLKDACIDHWMSVHCETDQQMDEALDDTEFIEQFDEWAYLRGLKQAGTEFVIMGNELGVYC
ncbi:MAG: hypothetical protein PWQ06_1110 [Anaerophaga sp.]|jgi:hypothetical protein|nr:hypothetical protein [Anaerophaga sp.]